MASAELCRSDKIESSSLSRPRSTGAGGKQETGVSRRPRASHKIRGFKILMQFFFNLKHISKMFSSFILKYELAVFHPILSSIGLNVFPVLSDRVVLGAVQGYFSSSISLSQESQ